MPNNNARTMCLQVEEQLANLLDGDLDVSLIDHISDCDHCRDLRYEVMQAAKLLEQAGSDFVLPDNFEQKVLDAIAARGIQQEAPKTSRLGSADPQQSTAQSPSTIVAEEPQRSTLPFTAPASPIAEPVQRETLPIPQPAPVVPVQSSSSSPSVAVADESSAEKPVAQAAAVQEPAKPPAHVVVIPRTSMPKIIGLGIVSIATLAAAAAVVMHVRSSSSDGTPTSTGPAWEGKVAAISQTTKGAKGLQICRQDGSGCEGASDGARLNAGSLIKTDATTRAHLELSDGTKLSVDRSTEIGLSANAGRSASLVRGAIVADVAHLEKGSNAIITVPDGRVEVLGTKFALSVSGDRSTVEVVRGRVRFGAKSSDSVVVMAGEEATLAKGGAPVVAPAARLAESVVWSERNEAEQEIEESKLVGLGELRAKKPGQTAEKDQAVRLAKHDVKVRIADSVARTEIDETFSNESGDVLEGIYRFPLPPDAQIERLALEVDGKLEDGAFVEKERAAAIWRGVLQHATPNAPKPREEIVWVPGPWRDPALLEWQRGGRFELKIFPIPARGSRRIVIAYTQTIAPSGGLRKYTYPLSYDASGSTRVGEFNVDVQVRGQESSSGVRSRGYEMASAKGDSDSERLTMHASSFVPSGDLTIEYALPGDKKEVTAWGYRAADVAPSGDAGAAPIDNNPYVAIALRPKLPRWSEGKRRDQVIVVDSSRSMVGERYKRAIRLAEAVVREMDPRDQVAVLACDSTCQRMPGGMQAAGGSAARMVRSFLSSIEPEGGSDLVEAISQARSLDKGLSEESLRIVYIGDGTPSVGAVRTSHLTQEISRVLPGGGTMLNTVAVGADADTPSLSAMARGGGGVMIPYVPGEKATSVALQVLGASYGLALRNPVLELPEGMVDVYPRQLDTMRAGGETIVVGRLTRGQLDGSIKLKGKVGGTAYEQSFPIKIEASTSSGNAFVPRLFAAIKINDLEATRGDSAKTELIDLSKRFAVASRFTSLLVLESPAMFRAFGVDRANGSAPIWSGESSAERAGADGTTQFGEDLASPEEEKSSADKGKKESRGDNSMNPYLDDDSFGGGHASGGGLAGGGYTAGPKAASASPVAAGRAAADSYEDAPARKRPAGPPAPAATSTIARDERRRPPPNYIPMRRVWDRSGSISTEPSSAKMTALAKISAAENESNMNPDSRTKLEALLKLYAVTGQVERASELANKWSQRDALDSSALIARASIAARTGDRAKSIRILSGLADLRPGDISAQSALVSVFESLGEASRACSHRIALASLRAKDAPAIAEALRCARATGRNSLADAMFADVTVDTTRSAVERELTKVAGDSQALRGDLQVDATWDVDADLDIALIGKNGERLGLVGDTKAKVTVRSASSRRNESLAVMNAGAGDYIVEITRTDGSGDSAVPIRGTLTVRVPGGASRQIPFILGARRLEVAVAKVSFTARLVPY